MELSIFNSQQECQLLISKDNDGECISFTVVPFNKEQKQLDFDCSVESFEKMIEFLK